MKILIYINKEKDEENIFHNSIVKILCERKIEYKILTDSDLNKKISGDALFVAGGDGTILSVTSFATKNKIPIIGFNFGKLGFLTEFEKFDFENSIDLFVKGKLKKDCRNVIKATFNNKEYFALNDIVVQKIFIKENARIINVLASIDGNNCSRFNGDGVIVCSPTGSTAYSLSCGGSVLAPNVNAFSIVSIASHSLIKDNVIFSADSKCELKLDCKNSAGLFVDGEYVDSLCENDIVVIEKSLSPITFLRKESFNFYERLTQKLSNNR